ncbi:cytochrome P450 [Streptomyces sp. RPA4-5]|nr:cytochrome P450 [Streptomyces sp. RPA4-5]
MASTEGQATPTPPSYPFRQARGVGIDPEFARLRHDAPLARVTMPYGGQAWLVTRYEDVRTVLGDRRFSRAATLGRDVPRLVPLVQRVSSILTLDPPDHTRHRRLVSRAFTPRRMEELRPKVEQFVDELIDELVGHGKPADMVAHVTRPLPVMVICELLGVPFGERHLFYTWSEAMRSTGADAVAKMKQAGQLPWDYLADRISVERENPSDNLLGTLVRARDEEERLSEQELVSFAVTLLLAGHETTTDELGNFLYTLLVNPAHLEQLRAHPDMLEPAIEELLRFVPIGTLSGFTRIATEDVRLSGGLVRAGDSVVVQADSANRDESVFTDPDELDFQREPNRHLAFGHGPHHCLGAQLARIELRAAIGALLARLPALALAVSAHEVSWKLGRSALGPQALPVRW